MRALSNALLTATAVFAVVSMAAPPAEAGGKWRARWAFSSDHGGHSSGAPGGSTGGSPGSYHNGGGDGGGGSAGGGGILGGGSNRGAPGPIAGAGLPFLLLAGGYVLVRRHRKRA